MQVVNAGIIAASSRINETSFAKGEITFFAKTVFSPKLYFTSRSKDLCYHKENNEEKPSDKLRNSNIKAW